MKKSNIKLFNNTGKAVIFFQSTFLVILVLLAIGCSEKLATPEDWPQFKNDNFRSGTSTVDLDLETLDLEWTYTASQPPAPAWYGPAKEDAFAKSGPLPSMRDYDLAYYPVIVGDNLFYSSSSDDAVHCLDVKNGKEKWHYTTDGPVRIAPVYQKGKLYFGSDDGFVYCIDADDATLEWKYSPVPAKERLLLQNGRLISFWPIRTGVLVEDDRVYFGASLLPWKKSYFCSINSKNGKPIGEGCYVKEMENMTFEGAMASTGTMLIQPQGRIAPVFFSKSNGENKGSLPGTGGCFVLVTNEKHVVHGQESRFKSIGEFVSKEEPEYLSFKGGKEMVIKGDTSFILTDNSISAYHRQSKKMLWLRRNYQAHRLILSGNTLYVGATDTVYAVSPENGLPLWKGNIEGTVYALATANNALFVSTGEGKISCFKAGGRKNDLLQKNLTIPAAIEEQPAKNIESTAKETLALKSGPFVNALSSDSVRLSFETLISEAVKISWRASGFEMQQYSLPENEKHSIDLPVRKDFIYTYQISTANGSTINFEYDNFFNYIPRPLDFHDLKISSGKNEAKTEERLKGIKENTGMAVVIGLEDEQLPTLIARNSNYDVIALEKSQTLVDDWRKMLQKSRVYGRRLNALQIANAEALPVASEIANLVWVNTSSELDADEVIRLLAPGGIAIVDGRWQELFENSNLAWQVESKELDEDGFILKKHQFEISGNWTHQYASPDNSAYGGESFWGSTRSEDFEIQWMGRPGPRFQTDRSGRKPSPLAVGGRMFVQGNERVVAVDIYNGSILWAKDFPGLKRMNIHRDCSNWAADDDNIYMAIGPDLVKANQKSGEIAHIFSVNREQSDWGFVGTVDDMVIGSSIPERSNYTIYHGGVGWYDAKDGMLAYKVVSTSLFTKDNMGSDIWSYQPKGVIINPTITVYNNQICFVESFGVKLSNQKRGANDLFENSWLTALDLKSGKLLWKKRIRNLPGKTMYSMAAGNGKYVIVSSSDWKYEIYTYDASNGELLWDREQKWFHGDHGGHLSRPAVVNNRLVVKPAHYNLETGDQYDYNVPKSGHGCASYALTDQAIFYRGGSVTQFNFDTREFSRWERLRPDCWISTIPALGMVLSPEAGGGCSCGNWLETSMVLAPVSRAPITIKAISGAKPDYTQESWGDYTQRYLPNEFIDSIVVEVMVKPGVGGILRYTIDNTDPIETSSKYAEPLVFRQNTNLKTAIFIEKEGKLRTFARSRKFVRLRPEPIIESQRAITNRELQVLFSKHGNTGSIYYTTDGTDPDSKSTRADGPLILDIKTLVKAQTIWKDQGTEYRSEIVAKEIDVPELNEGVEVSVIPGIYFEYFEGTWKALPDFDNQEVLKHGVQEVFDISGRKSDYGYGFRFIGFLNVPVDGIYTLYTTSNDASSIWLHNEKLVDNDGSHAAREVKEDVSLKAGLHPIEVMYYQNESGQVFKVEIEGPGITKQAIPSEMLFHHKPELNG